MTMKVRKPPYSDVIQLDQRLYVMSARPSYVRVYTEKHPPLLGANSNETSRSLYDVERRSCQCPLDTLNSKPRSKRLRNLRGGQ